MCTIYIYIYIEIDAYIHIHTYIHSHINMYYIYIYIYIYIKRERETHMCMHMLVCVYICICIHGRLARQRVVQSCTSAQSCPVAQVYSAGRGVIYYVQYVCVYIYIYIYIYVHITYTMHTTQICNTQIHVYNISRSFPQIRHLWTQTPQTPAPPRRDVIATPAAASRFRAK